MILGSDDAQWRDWRVPSPASRFRSNYNPNFAPEVPQFDVAYLVLSSAIGADRRSRSPATDEARALGTPGAPWTSAAGGAPASSGGAPDTLRAATVNVIADSTCSGRLRRRRSIPTRWSARDSRAAGWTPAPATAADRWRRRSRAADTGWSVSRAGARVAPRPAARASTRGSRARRCGR